MSAFACRARKHAITDNTRGCARLNSARWHFLCLTFPVQIPCCFWMLAVCSCLHLPLVSTSQEECRFPALSILSPSVFLFLHSSFLDPAVFLSGCCSSALELSCWKCQKLAFSPCRVTAVSLISSMHFLFAHWNCVGLGLLLGGCCVFAEETFVSQKRVAVPCHCPKSIDQLCLVFHTFFCTFLAFLSIS